jgi:hypothetical protein
VFGDDQEEYEQQQLAKILPAGACGEPFDLAALPNHIIAPTSSVSKPLGAGSKFLDVNLENPFKPHDTVLTQIKGAEAEVTVRQIWKREVQVKTADGTLLWRTMHTVWYPGTKPIQKVEVPNPVETVGKEAARTHCGTEEGVLPAQATLNAGRNGASNPKPDPQAAIATSQKESSLVAVTKEQKLALARKRRARRLGKKKGN